MRGGEVQCTVKVVTSRVLMFAGILGGVLLAVLGIVTITADTPHLFASPFVRFYTNDVVKINFKDTGQLSILKVWLRPQDEIEFTWTSTVKRRLMLCNNDHQPISPGFRTALKTVGDEIVSVANLSTGTSHYFCVSDETGERCTGYWRQKGEIAMYDGSVFQTNGQLGQQNMRFTLFALSVVIISFGIIMVLGELHVPLITTKFTFFYYSFVKGIIYLAFGFLVMGMSNLFGLFVAIYFWIIGIANCVYGWRSLAAFQWKSIGGRGTTTIVTRREYI